MDEAHGTSIQMYEFGYVWEIHILFWTFYANFCFGNKYEFEVKKITRDIQQSYLQSYLGRKIDCELEC